MKENNMDFITRYDIFRKELCNAFLILIEEKGEQGVLDIKGMGVKFDGEPIAYVKVNRDAPSFFTDNEEYYGFYSENLKDMCRLYDDIAEVLK